jgi:hypothetical protein
MLSYTDLLRVSHADAVDDDADNVESIVLICLPYDKMAKEIVVISPTSTKEDSLNFIKTNFMLQYAKVNFGRMTTTDVIKYGLNKIHAS